MTSFVTHAPVGQSQNFLGPRHGSARLMVVLCWRILPDVSVLAADAGSAAVADLVDDDIVGAGIVGAGEAVAAASSMVGAAVGCLTSVAADTREPGLLAKPAGLPVPRRQQCNTAQFVAQIVQDHVAGWGQTIVAAYVIPPALLQVARRSRGRLVSQATSLLLPPSCSFRRSPESPTTATASWSPSRALQPSLLHRELATPESELCT